MIRPYSSVNSTDFASWKLVVKWSLASRWAGSLNKKNCIISETNKFSSSSDFKSRNFYCFKAVYRPISWLLWRWWLFNSLKKRWSNYSGLMTTDDITKARPNILYRIQTTDPFPSPHSYESWWCRSIHLKF